MVELVVFQKSGPYPDLVQQTYDPDAREAEVEVEAEVEIEAEKQRQRGRGAEGRDRKAQCPFSLCNS